MAINIRDWLPLLFCGLSIPISLFMWLGNSFLSKLWTNEFEESPVIPPTRWLFSILAPFMLMVVALKRKSVNKSGAALGIIVAIILSISNHAFFASLAVFFFTSSRATKFRSHMKRKIEKDFKEGEGQRSWVQVLCNSGMATQLAILYLIDVGSSERTIDFVRAYRASWLGIAVMAVFASCNGDTWASELGSVLSRSDPYLITTFKKVPRGTNGGVSLIGLLVSFLAGVVVGAAYYITVYFTAPAHMHLVAPPQWPLILWGGIAGLFGSLVDSLLGATLQYSGIDEEGKIVDSPASNVRYISGLRIIDNHSVNLISSIVTGVCIPVVAMKFWPER
ncbi:transmembrane protein 19 isoform X2 [Musca vetustissima]|uniref:transmembrane protein 19 isoform X2 n=1 Tax=Musca vetustissima TaxID=27455 RepID=UPI002AB78196|nr:transmembrane protein 19 isoform X2 [Musca vetustissima]